MWGDSYKSLFPTLGSSERGKHLPACPLIRTAVVGGTDYPEVAYLPNGTGHGTRSLVFMSLRSVQRGRGKSLEPEEVLMI